MKPRAQNIAIFARAVYVALVIGLGGCASQEFVVSPHDSQQFIQRAITQTENQLTVTAAVPTAAEFEGFTGLELHAKDMQPVWIEIHNNSQYPARVTLVSIDDQYFSPMEVAWTFRKQFNNQQQDKMERWFHETQLPRRIPPESTISGFVYTNLTEGTKGFNVDIFTLSGATHFTFFVPIPGFNPDYMDVRFEMLYDEQEIQATDVQGFIALIEDLSCCSTDESGRLQGDPFNVVILGTPDAVRRSLLRGHWQETPAQSPDTRLARTHYYRGRQPDGTFVIFRPDNSARKELRLWLAPILVDNETVWLGQISNGMSGLSAKRDLDDYKIDPDLDDARMFLMQNFWYAQSLQSATLAGGLSPVTIDEPRTNFHGSQYFTDGMRAILFVSAEPVAMDETKLIMMPRRNAN